ncbi:PH domain-containing protein [Flavobacterium frigidarium]|uniref:PH domain-containing protein n=1 Tax=Flavobacterium frigidarium TaxID=99286 RepID=UPI0003F84F4A|nr:PH domain-containing protein [Flavobacterium frigidarium]
MEPQFSLPQRQSAIGVLIMFFNTLQKMLRGLGPLFLVFVVKYDSEFKQYGYAAIAVVLFLTVLIAYLKYRNFTFYLDDENREFIIQEGIFNKTKTIIQLDKIQQVNINQSLLQRLINVYEVNVDTAGSDAKEGEIKAVDHKLALALKARLLEVKSQQKDFLGTTVADEDILVDESSMESESQLFLKISFRSLFKVGITSNYVKTFTLILAFFTTIYENGKHIFSEQDLDKQNKNLDHFFTRSSDIAALVFIVIVLILVVNLVRVIFKYFDYQIKKQHDNLLLSFGLLSTKSTIIKPERVQIVTITRNYFQKKMNILELKIKQASSGVKQEKKALIEIPGCNEVEKEAVLKMLFDKAPEKGLMLKPNYRKLVFSLFLFIFLPCTAFWSFAYYVDPEVFDYKYVMVIYSLFLLLILVFGFRNNRLYVSDDFIIKQSGAWDVDNSIIEPLKIQAITTSQLFWHKKANIGSVTIHTAGGDLSFQLGDYAKIKDYVNLWLYKIEISNSNWM